MAVCLVCTCLTVECCLAGVFVMLATAVAPDVLLLPRVVMLCSPALVLFNVLFDLAMVSTICIVLGLHC